MSETNGAAVRLPPREQIEERLITEATAGYTPSLPVGFMTNESGPDFYQLWFDLEEMLLHPRVVAALTYYKGGIANAKFKVTASSPDVAEFVQKELASFWKLRDIVQRCYDYGRVGCEVIYKVTDGQLHFDRLGYFRPNNVTVLTRNHKYMGIRVQNVQHKGKVDLWGPANGPAKAFWHAHNTKFNRWYGLTQCYGAWRPWRRLAGRNGAEEVTDHGVYRYAFSGPVIYCPGEDIRKPKIRGGSSGGTTNASNTESAAQHMREYGEKAKAGAYIVLPSENYSNDQGGGRKYAVEWPQHVLDVEPLGLYSDRLEDQITLGIGVPPELMEASQTGSGYSGRAIPLEGYYCAQQQNAESFVRSWKEQIGDPLVKWNYGGGAWFEVEVESLLESRVPPATANVPGQSPGQHPGGPQPPPDTTGMQFALDEPNPSGPSGWGRIVVNEASHIRIVGETKSGKTTVARAIAAALPGKLFIIDPVWRPGSWGGLPAATVSKDGDYGPIKEAIQGILAEMRRRTAELQDGKEDFERLTIIFDEVPDTVAELPDDAGFMIRRLGQRGRHVNMHLIGIGQSMRVGAWGIEGFGDATENFATIYLGKKAVDTMPSLVGQARPAVLEWQGKKTVLDMAGIAERSNAKIPKEREFRLTGASEEIPNDDTEMAHAPHGGVTIGGKFFKGGEFIPGEVLANATEEEKAKIVDHQESAQPVQKIVLPDGPNKKKQLAELRKIEQKAQKLEDASRNWPGERGQAMIHMAKLLREKAVLQAKVWISEHKKAETGPAIQFATTDQPAHNWQLEEIIRRASEAAVVLGQKVRDDILKAAKEAGPDGAISAIRAVLDDHREDLVTLIGQSRLASLMAGMDAVAEQLPVDMFPIVAVSPVEIPPLSPSGVGPSIPVAAPGVSLPPTEPPTPSALVSPVPEDPVFPVIKRAVENLQSRRVMTREAFDQLDAEAKRQAFTYAGEQSEAVIDRVKNVLAETVRQGGDTKDFVKGIEDAVGHHTFKSPSHAENVFRTNAMEAYSDGQDHLLKHPVVNLLFPYAQIWPIHDDRVRPTHLALEKQGLQGTNIYPRDSDVWRVIRPPNDFQCRCAWAPLSITEAAKRGIEEAIQYVEKGVWPAERQTVPMPEGWPPASGFRSQGMEFGIEWVRAPKGGQVSPVNSKFYEGGEFMPIHGQSDQEPGKKGKPKPTRTLKTINRFGEYVEVPEGHRAIESLLGGHPSKVGKLGDDALAYLGVTREQANHLKDIFESDGGSAYVPTEIIPPSAKSTAAKFDQSWNIKEKWEAHKKAKGEAARQRDAERAKDAIEEESKDSPHVADISAIPSGEARHVAGYFIRNMGGKFQLQTDKDEINGPPEQIAKYLADQHESRKHLQPMIDAALLRAANTSYTDFFGGASDYETDSFLQIPLGEPVVSLAANTSGRLGKIVDRDGKRAVKLDGTPGYVSNDVEPLDKKWSWRARKLGEYKDPPKQEQPKQQTFFGPFEFRTKPTAGRWITIGAKLGPDGKKHGGSPVFVEGGRIIKGHPRLTGKAIGNMVDENDNVYRTALIEVLEEKTSHRKELNQSRQYARAVWAKKARAEGINPSYLHQLASETLAHDKEYKSDVSQMLKEARQSLSAHSGHVKVLQTSDRIEDAAQVPGLDEVAEDMAKRHPSYFPEGEHASDVLFTMLREGNPEPMAEDDAYSQAFDHLIEERDKYRSQQEEEVPFSFEFAHAPVGGITIGGKFFKGGEFIPTEHVEKATPEQKSKLVRDLFDQAEPDQVAPKAEPKKTAVAGLPDNWHSMMFDEQQAWAKANVEGWAQKSPRDKTRWVAEANASKAANDAQADEVPGEPVEESPPEIPSPRFTGTLTDSLGRDYYFVDGKRVESEVDVEAALESGSPRESAEREAETAYDSDYAFARKSAVRNAGEDLLGSARHKVNAWRGLAQAEQDGTASEMVTRENLLKAEPPNLTDMMNEKPAYSLTALAMHLALAKYPQMPVKEDETKHYKDHPEFFTTARRWFYDGYREAKETAEHLAKTEHDPVKALNAFHAKARERFQKLRAGTDDEFKLPGQDEPGTTMGKARGFRYVASNAYVRFLNSNSTNKYTAGKNGTISQLHDFSGRLKNAYGDNIDAKTLENFRKHALDVMEGDSFNKTFGTVGKKAKEFNPADLYVKHAERKGGRVVDAKTVKAGTDFMLKNLGMRGVQYGNSVTDDERQHHLQKAAEAFADLADVLGLDDFDMSLNGKLGIAFGARGHGNAMAHYEPDKKVINLTRKNGVGSLAHEWGHFFDHHVEGDGKGTWYASNYHWGPDAVKDNPLRKAYADWHAAIVSSGFRERLSNAISAERRQGRLSDKKAEYWRSDIEVFARSFERYVQHKLETKGQKNTYLAGFMKHEFWPTDDEVKAMAPAFDAIFKAYREAKG